MVQSQGRPVESERSVTPLETDFHLWDCLIQFRKCSIFWSFCFSSFCYYVDGYESAELPVIPLDSLSNIDHNLVTDLCLSVF